MFGDGYFGPKYFSRVYWPRATTWAKLSPPTPGFTELSSAGGNWTEITKPSPSWEEVD